MQKIIIYSRPGTVLPRTTLSLSLFLWLRLRLRSTRPELRVEDDLDEAVDGLGTFSQSAVYCNCCQIQENLAHRIGGDNGSGAVDVRGKLNGRHPDSFAHIDVELLNVAGARDVVNKNDVGVGSFLDRVGRHSCSRRRVVWSVNLRRTPQSTSPTGPGESHSGGPDFVLAVDRRKLVIPEGLMTDARQIRIEQAVEAEDL